MTEFTNEFIARQRKLLSVDEPTRITIAKTIATEALDEIEHQRERIAELDNLLQLAEGDKQTISEVMGNTIKRRDERIAELEAERRWIPVGERLPECGEIVSWSHPSWNRTKEGYMTGSGRLKVWGGAYLKIDNMKWQTLSQPPQEEE